MDYRILRLAIDNISPNAEYSIDEGDLDKLTWISGDNLPSKSDIIAEMQKVEAEQVALEEAKAAVKAAAEAKLAALGLTAEEIAALGK